MAEEKKKLKVYLRHGRAADLELQTHGESGDIAEDGDDYWRRGVCMPRHHYAG